MELKTPAEIQKYWDARAQEFSGCPEATTPDVYLRELEINTLLQILDDVSFPPSPQILDVGCGDGYSTLRVASHFKQAQFTALDYSPAMIASAKQALQTEPDLAKRITFNVGDATQLAEQVPSAHFDVVLTMRCLINLHSAESQAAALQQIASVLKPGGYYVGIENFIEAHNNLNEARAHMKLPEIPVRWHNLYFEESVFLEQAKRSFETVTFHDFASAYYFATRVLYAALCQEKNETPDYRHPLHRLGISLPWIGQFSPVRLVVLRKASA